MHIFTFCKPLSHLFFLILHDFYHIIPFMKKLLFIAMSLTALLFLTHCSNRNTNDTDGYGNEYPRTKEASAIIDSCMSFMHTDPAKSHKIIDSVCQAKLMSPQRCDYYHAMVVFCGEEKHDSALAICDRLLDERKFGDDQYLEEEICVLASNITLCLGRYLKTLEYANRGIAICHGHESMNDDEATLLGRVCQSEQLLGHMEEAKQTYAEANKLLKNDKTFGGLIARISLMMKQISLYFETKEYDKVLTTCNEVLAIVQNFDRDPSSFNPRPETMSKSGAATREFADFYESQMYCRIARAYRHKIEEGNSEDSAALRDSLNINIDKWAQTQSHDSPTNLANLIRELFFAGRTEEFNNAKEIVANLYKSDSISAEYVDFLSLLAEDAASRQDFQSSNRYLQRALAISDSIRQHETLRSLSEQMSIYMVQQEQLARQEAEYRVSHYKMINVAIIITVILIAASGFAIAILRRKNKENEEILQITQQELIEAQEEVHDIFQQLEETRQEKQTKDMNELFARIEQVVKEKKLYLNPDLNMDMLADALNSNRSSISSCINSIAHKSFRAWLSEYRLNIFLEKQKQNPDLSIDKLLQQCGYKDQSTFRRQFKATFGMPPSKYNKNEDITTEK